jgi:hypothetical protein
VWGLPAGCLHDLGQSCAFCPLHERDHLGLLAGGSALGLPDAFFAPCCFFSLGFFAVCASVREPLLPTPALASESFAIIVFSLFCNPVGSTTFIALVPLKGKAILFAAATWKRELESLGRACR